MAANPNRRRSSSSDRGFGILSRTKRDYRMRNTRGWLKVECLEERFLLALTNPFELSSLVGGNGSAGVVFDNIASDQYGAVVSSAGDFNGDNVDDLLIAAPGADHFDEVRPNTGLVYIVFGTEGAPPDTDLANLSGKGVEIFGAEGFQYLGLSAASLGDFNGDGFDDVIIGSGAVYDYNSYSGALKSYIVFGTDAFNSEDPPNVLELDQLGDGGIELTGYSYDYAATSVSGAGDINGDGLPDAIIGDYLRGNDYGDIRVGKAHVVFGSLVNPETIDLDSLGDRGFTLFGVEANDQAGFSVAGVGDLNGDGIDDLGVGANYGGGYDNSLANGGEAYVVFGANGLGDDIELGALNGGGLTIFGPADNANAGHALSTAGDINGDGIDDLLVGAPSKGVDPGSAFVVFGSDQLPGTIDLASLGGAGIAITGADAGDRAGFSVSGGGDINGDGFADVILGAFHASPYDPGTSTTRVNAGISYVLFGASELPSAIDLSSDSPSVVKIFGAGEFQYSGSSVAVAGDINGDGADDLLVSSNYDDIRQAYLIFGEPTADWGDAIDPDFRTLAANNGARHIVTEGLHLGSSVDVEGDGQPTALADGDGDDEDGVTPLTIFGQGLTSTLTVNASADGFLDVWFDVNNDGTWDHETESIGPSLSLAEGDNTVTVELPDEVAIGQLAARFRFSSAGSLLPAGLAEDGEVEDYVVSVGPYPYYNAVTPTDVDGLNGTTPFDALLVINELDLPNFHDPDDDGNVFAPPLGGTAPVSFFDVDRSKFISPFDALLVINDLDPLASSSAVLENSPSPSTSPSSPNPQSFTVIRAEPREAARFALAVDAVMASGGQSSRFDLVEEHLQPPVENPAPSRNHGPAVASTDQPSRRLDPFGFSSIVWGSVNEGNDSEGDNASEREYETEEDDSDRHWQLE